ncbi:MAG: GNAT family N-acetyltransferase [Bacillota bacterium]
MSKDVQSFNSVLGELFPGFTDILAEMRDRSVIYRVLSKIVDSGATMYATLPLGRSTKKSLEMKIEDSTIALLDIKYQVAYRVGMPLSVMAARFPKHPIHNFVRFKYDAVVSPEDKKKKLELSEDDQGDAEYKVKNVESPGWFILYPLGSLLADQRLENRIRDLTLNGMESAMLKEFIAIDEGELNTSQSIELVDYQPEDWKLWDQWMSKIDTDLFQTVVHPRNFSAASGRSDDYYLKIIRYGNMKIGAVWLEKINPRTATAELGLIIGEPHLWGMGIGSQVINLMINIAKNDLSLNFLWVSVREANQRAVSCYKRGGFLIVRKVPVFNKSDGSYQMWVHMEKMI